MQPSTRFVSVLPIARISWIRFLLAAISFVACVLSMAKASESQLTENQAVIVDRDVRAFMRSVAHDVTQDGPLAWIKYFDSSPAFFMVVNGQMAFPDRTAAQEGTRKFAQTIRQIELNWGDDLRIDPLTAEVAIVAASWRENWVDTAGHRLDDAGYFTGVAEYRNGHWQFRDAHWSAPVPKCQK
jgi:hypothetical protein